MTPAEIEKALQAAFSQCTANFCSLSEQQKEILRQFLVNELILDKGVDQTVNPLDELTSEERELLLEFVQEQEKVDRSWKVQLLNDWLNDRPSGNVQFLRDRYGIGWLDRVQAGHLAQYSDSDLVKLKIGDRIEVSNSLWEWVQENGPCTQEWFPCTIVGVRESSSDRPYISCTIRFDTGIEYEIQGMYQWNRYYWRWASL